MRRTSEERPGRPEQVLERLVGDLERWGALFLEIARSRGHPAAERVLGGLAEWLGNDLLDGWLHLPIPVFERLSDRSEQLFQACREYQERLRRAPGGLPEDDRRPSEAAIASALDRIRELGVRPGGRKPSGEPGRQPPG